jgi:hypothetical protein
MITCGNYLSTFLDQIKQMEKDPTRVFNILTFQSLLFPLASLFSIIVGMIMVKKGVGFSFWLMAIITVIFGGISVVPNY